MNDTSDYFKIQIIQMIVTGQKSFYTRDYFEELLSVKCYVKSIWNWFP